MSKKDQHVVPHAASWAVKAAGNQRASSVHPTQAEAIASARDAAIKGQSAVTLTGCSHCFHM